MNRNKFLADCTVQEFTIICKSLIDYYLAKQSMRPLQPTIDFNTGKIFQPQPIKLEPGDRPDLAPEITCDSSVDVNQVRKAPVDSFTVDFDLKTKGE